MASLFGQDISFLDQAYSPKPTSETGSASFFKGWQMRQQQQQLQMEQQKQAVMLPLQQKAAELQLQGSALDIVAKTHQAEYSVQQKAGEAELSQALANTNWENPIDRSKLWGIVAKYPVLGETKMWVDAQKQMEISDQAAHGRAEALAASKLFGQQAPVEGAMTANPLEATTSGGTTSITPESLQSALSTPGLEGKGIENVLSTAARYELYRSRTQSDRTPNIIEAGGSKFLINPITGSAHEIKGPADQTALGIRATHDFQTAHNNWMGSLLKLRQQISDMGNPTSDTGKQTLSEMKTLLQQHQSQEPKLEDYTSFLRQDSQQPNTPPAPSYSTKDDVVNDYKSGKLTREKAVKILNEQFGVPLTR